VDRVLVGIDSGFDAAETMLAIQGESADFLIPTNPRGESAHGLDRVGQGSAKGRVDSHPWPFKSVRGLPGAHGDPPLKPAGCPIYTGMNPSA